MVPLAEPYVGKVRRGRCGTGCFTSTTTSGSSWDITLARTVSSPDLSASGGMDVTGAAWPGPADPQPPPAGGTSPRIDVGRPRPGSPCCPIACWRTGERMVSPVVVPIQIAGHDQRGLRLVVPPGLLPPGGRRAGLLAHAYRAHLIGLTTRVFTGWLEAGDEGAVYAPHTYKGFVAPPRKDLLLVSNGLMAKFGTWQAGASRKAQAGD